MADKLTEEELLDELGLAFENAMLHARTMYKWRLPSIEQAYTQLKEIVEFYFNDSPKEGHMKIADHPDIPFMKEIQQKPEKKARPTVTKEWVSDRVDKEWEECEYGTPQYPHGPETYDVKGLIVNILTELGVVEEKDE